MLHLSTHVSHTLNQYVVPSLITLSFCAPRPDYNGICSCGVLLCDVIVVLLIKVQGMFQLCCFFPFFPQQIMSAYQPLCCPSACCRQQTAFTVGLFFNFHLFKMLEKLQDCKERAETHPSHFSTNIKKHN